MKSCTYVTSIYVLVHGSKGRCMDVKCKRLRRMLAMLRGGTAALRIETRRWNGLKREERICRQCTMGEIEDEEHFCYGVKI